MPHVFEHVPPTQLSCDIIVVITLTLQMRASLVAQRLKRLPARRETWVQSLGREDPPGERNGNPFQYSCLENPMDRGAFWATVHGVTKSRTRLSDFTFTISLSGSQVAQTIKCLPAMQETWLIPGSGRSPEEGIGYPLQYSWNSHSRFFMRMVKNLPAMWETWI